MDKKILNLLARVKDGTTGVHEAYDALRGMPFEDLEHTKIDYHRSLRRGLQEVVFGEGKEPGQILEIVKSMRNNDVDVLVTRVDGKVGKKIRDKFPEGTYDGNARCFFIKKDHAIKGKGTVLVVSAGTSDSKVAEEAYVTSLFFGNETRKLYDVGVAGIHRLFSNLDVLKDARVIIVAAGMEGALPSVVAGMVAVPVIGVPTSIGYGASFGGLTALLAMLNSCSTVSVFNIDNGFGAAYFATLINRL
jgi:pyridinium-3,5-biscarboxylic acid mononucleotide synthase